MAPPEDARSAPTTRPKQPQASRIGQLVIGYDGSDGANAAAAFGLWLAGRTGCAATVVHAGPTPETVPSADLLPSAAEQVVAYEREWRWRLKNLREDAADDAVVQCRVIRGSAAGVLIAAAVDAGADLILTGSRGVGRVRGALLGSVSAQVLTHAPCSVMLFPDGERSVSAVHAGTIVVGVDGSASSRRALEFAQALAVPLGARLVLVHAYDPHIPFAVMTTEGIHEMLRRRGHDLLQTARDGLTASGDVVGEVVEGPAREALVAACERHAPALLMVGSRGLGGFEELLLGSTSRWVVNNAPCPVLVTRRSAFEP